MTRKQRRQLLERATAQYFANLSEEEMRDENRLADAMSSLAHDIDCSSDDAIFASTENASVKG